MSESINSIITEAKHTEPFLRLPSSLSRLIKTPFSPLTIDLNNIVKSKTLPKFLHDGLRYSTLANTQTGSELLKTCNLISTLVPSIWKYFYIADPTIVVPTDFDTVFDFSELQRYEKYDVKLTARYWAQEVKTLLEAIDDASRLAIKHQTRLALCLFEVAELDVSVFSAYTILVYTSKLQREKENLRESYIEFAKIFASLMDKISVKDLKEKMTKESILYQTIEMDSELIDHLDWLQRMLYKHPESTMETWSEQLVLIGPWMNRVFVPWMQKCASVSLFPDLYPLKKKTGPIEKVAAALARHVSYSYTETKKVCEILTDLYMDRDPEDRKIDELNTICIKHSGLDIVEWCAIFDASLQYEDILVENRLLEEIQKDIDEWTRKTKNAQAALIRFLEDRAFIEFESSNFKLFANHIADTYNDLDKDDLVRKRERFFPNLNPENFDHLVDYVVDYYKARDQLLKFEAEARAPYSSRARVTLTIQSELAVKRERHRLRRQLFLDEAHRRLGPKFSELRFLAYLDWYQDEGYRLQVIDSLKFVEDTEARLDLPFKLVEPLFMFMEDLLRANRAIVNLEIELNKHRGKLKWRRQVLTVIIFLVFGLGILFLINAFCPIFYGTAAPTPVNPVTNQPIIPESRGQTPITENPNPSIPEGIWSTIGSAASWIANTRLTNNIVSRLDIYLQDRGWRRFDVMGRVLSGQFWTDTLWRAGGGVLMTLLYTKVIITTAWTIMYLMWGTSAALARTTTMGVWDESGSQTWRRERVRIVELGSQAFFSMVANVMTVQSAYIENQRETFAMGIQLMQYGPGFTQAIAGRLQNYVDSPNRRAIPDRMREFIENNNNLPRNERRPQALDQTVPDANSIAGPRIQEMADETEQNEGGVVPYQPPEFDPNETL